MRHNARMSGANKKQAAAQKARLEREAAERQAAERSKRLKLLGGAVGLVVLIVAIVLAAGAFKSDPTDKASVTNDVKGVQETKELTSGLQQKGTVLGNPDAPVTIHEFADVKCPVCQQFEVTSQKENVDKLVRTGKANLQVHLVNIIDDNAGTSDGAMGRIAANNLAAKNKFFDFLSTLYYNQKAETDSWIDEDSLKKIAAEVPGVGADAINTRETPASRALAAEADDKFTALKAGGTPAFFVQARGTRAYTPVDSSVDAIAAGVDEAAKSAKKATR
jgi:protein-disulfide isomerase